MPEITALMSVYNGEDYIKEAIDSVLNQTFSDFEFIIVNDGSTDNTEKIIKAYDDKRIRYFSFEKNQGVGAALNYGLKQAKGKYVAKVDADDINHLRRFEIQYEFLRNNKDIGLVQSYVKYFPDTIEVENSDRFKKKLRIYEMYSRLINSSEDISNALYAFCCVVHASIMGKTELLRQIGYDTKYKIGEDYRLFYELNKSGFKFETIPLELVNVRISDYSTTVREKQLFVKVNFQIKIEEIMNLYSKDSRQFVIWGASNFGKEVYIECNNNKLRIDGFIDSASNKQGHLFQGVPVYSPEVLDIESHKIIVASTDGKFEIIPFLREKGFRQLLDYIVIG